ncbi:MAG: hypothetical protein AB8G15_16215 [Saprospiraceae bacterium]
MSDRIDLKEYFETGKKPTQGEYADLIDSTVHKSQDKASVAEAEAGTVNDKYVTPATAKKSVEKFAVGAVPEASETVKGKVELADLTEVGTGSNTTKAVTPAGAKKAAQVHAPVKSINGQDGVVVLDLSGEDSGWQTPSLESGISNFGGTYQSARYRKKNGVVFIEGSVKQGTATGTVTVFQLGGGYKPSKRLVFNTYRSTGVGRTDVLSDGRVICYSYSSTQTSLSGISFLVD